VTKRRVRRPRGQLIETRALASELGALLERLEIDAVLTDRTGITLASTSQVDRRPHSDLVAARRVVEMRVYGHSLCVAVAGEGPTPPTTALTKRQREVSTLIREGLQNREIAARLGISVHTVRRHVEALLKRLDAPTRSSAAVRLSQVEHA
jgi:DNA-binding CsgD family transcriptional regulator